MRDLPLHDFLDCLQVIYEVPHADFLFGDADEFGYPLRLYDFSVVFIGVCGVDGRKLSAAVQIVLQLIQTLELTRLARACFLGDH